MDGLGFVFEKWLDPQTFTDHEAPTFLYESTKATLLLSQGTFEHNKRVDHTGTVVWDDAVVLSRYLELLDQQHPCFANKSVLELGAGVGLPGLLLAKLGASVVVSDRDDAAKRLLEENIKQNGLESACTAVVYEWGKDVMKGRKFDIILAR